MINTVVPYNGVVGTGFSFVDHSVDSLMQFLHEALLIYSDMYAWKKLMRRAMSRNWSWDTSARRYMKLYRQGRE